MPGQPPAADEPTVPRTPEETPTVAGFDTAAGGQQLTPGEVLGGRYRIVSLIGRGGMGEVYRADDLKVGHTVALKFLSQPQHATRLYEEVRVGREVSHPNVCRLYDVAEVGRRLFITMEFIDGEDLSSLLRRVGRLPPEKGLDVARDICAGLAAAHERGVIHRDLKPANVMIDGRGRGRVTDFGLADVGGGATDRSGTLAYMAPEQLSGESASVATDVYALGLVLYEIFTGRRPFEATSVHELVRRQHAVDYQRPASVTRDIPPDVERLIVSCLDPNPAARPASVAGILRELPGGDPLAAAVAAGETPSPEMVAAAAKSGDLPVLVAWGLLALAIAGVLATAALSELTVLSGASAMKSPDVLQERAREILAMAGVTERPADSDLIVMLERSAARHGVMYRQSTEPMRSRNALGRLMAFDPALDPGMANVQLNGNGSLRRLLIMPPVVDKSPVRAMPAWEPFLTAAGYDPRSLTPVQPEWAAAIVMRGRSISGFVDSDNKIAWRAKDGNRIEAASWRGRPVFFSVITPELAHSVSRKADQPPSVAERLASMMLVTFLIVLPIAALVLARTNLRKGRGDRAGAVRAATFVFFVALAGLVFQAHHPMSFFEEWTILSLHAALATLFALMTATMYIAVEPFVRRRWPQILISWARLLSGRSSDPMVGRDVLIGAAGAAVAMLVWQATHLISGQSAFGSTPSTLGPARFVVYAVAYTLAEAVFRGVGLVILLVLVRSVVRHDVLASVTSALLVATMTLGDANGPLWLRAFYAIAVSLLGVMLTRHFGVLAAMSYVFFVLIQQRMPFTLDANAWFFGRSTMVIVLLFALIAYAFRASLGQKRWLPRVALEHMILRS